MYLMERLMKKINEKDKWSINETLMFKNQSAKRALTFLRSPS